MTEAEDAKVKLNIVSKTLRLAVIELGEKNHQLSLGA